VGGGNKVGWCGPEVQKKSKNPGQNMKKLGKGGEGSIWEEKGGVHMKKKKKRKRKEIHVNRPKTGDKNLNERKGPGLNERRKANPRRAA